MHLHKPREQKQVLQHSCLMSPSLHSRGRVINREKSNEFIKFIWFYANIFFFCSWKLWNLPHGLFVHFHEPCVQEQVLQSTGTFSPSLHSKGEDLIKKYFSFVLLEVN